MPPENDLKDNGETEAMLVANTQIKIVSKKKPKKKKEDDGLVQDFLRSISSTATLPGYIKGNNFSSKRGVINQCLVAVAIFIVAAGCGQPIGFSAVLLPQLYAENSTMRIDMEMGSWIASIHSAATPVGSFASGPIMDWLGRRRALQLTLMPLIAGWIIMSLAKTHIVLLIGRVVCGLAVGCIAAVSQVYLGEISEPLLRGLLSGFPYIAYSTGILIIYSLGGAVHWRTAAGLGTVLPTVSILALIFAPESPPWLARQGKFSEATKAIGRLRGDDETAQRELHQLMSEMDKENRGYVTSSFWATVKQMSVVKPLIIANIFCLMQTMSGTYMIVFYAADIISNASGGSIDGVFAATMTAIVRLVFTVVSSILLFYIGKRVLAITSGMGTAVACLTLGIYMWCAVGNPKSEIDVWVTIVCFIVFISFNTIGFFILPGLMIGELLPIKVRGKCGGFLFTVLNLELFGITKLYPLIVSGLGTHGMFILFGCSAFSGSLFLYLFLPETKGRSLLQIEQYFKQSNFMWITRTKSVPDRLTI